MKHVKLFEQFLNEKREWGFDLTDIEGADWIKVLKSVNLDPNSGKKTDRGWVWENDKIMIVTANNPITGEHYSGRGNEKDYASYIGLEGDDATVVKAAKEIQDYAINIKDMNKKSRDFI